MEKSRLDVIPSLQLVDSLLVCFKDLANRKQPQESVQEFNRLINLYRNHPQLQAALETSFTDIFAYWVAGLLKAISDKITIKIGRLYSSRIGHLTTNLDYYVTTQRVKGEVTIFVLDLQIANPDFLNDIEDLYPGILFLPASLIGLYEKLVKLKVIDTLLINWNRQMHPRDFSVLGTSRPLIPIAKKSEEVSEIFKNIGLECNQSFVCFHNRDPEYLARTGGDGNFHAFRDSEFESFGKAISSLCSLGSVPVRIGSVVSKDVTFLTPMAVNATGAYSEGRAILWLGYHAKLWVCGNSGLNKVRLIFRKPILGVETFPFSIDVISSVSRGSSFLLRSIFSRKQDRYLSLSELYKIGSEYSIHTKSDYLAEQGLQLIPNSPEEIEESLRIIIEAPITSSQQTQSGSHVRSLNSRELFSLDPTLFSICERLSITVLVPIFVS